MKRRYIVLVAVLLLIGSLIPGIGQMGSAQAEEPNPVPTDAFWSEAEAPCVGKIQCTGWSAGTVPDYATLHPNKKTEEIDIHFQLDWADNRMIDIHSVSYGLIGRVAHSCDAIIVRPEATKNHPATAIVHIDYTWTVFGRPLGSYSAWLRCEIDSNNRMRIAWNY